MFAAMHVKRLVIKSHASKSEWRWGGQVFSLFASLRLVSPNQDVAPSGRKGRTLNFTTALWNHTALWSSGPQRELLLPKAKSLVPQSWAAQPRRLWFLNWASLRLPVQEAGTPSPKSLEPQPPGEDRELFISCLLPSFTSSLLSFCSFPSLFLWVSPSVASWSHRRGGGSTILQCLEAMRDIL